MSIKYNGKTISGPGNSAYIGANGNWWVGDIDQKVPASIKNNVNLVTQSQLDNSTTVGVYIVTDPDNLGIWFIDTNGVKTSVNGVTPSIGTNGNWYIGNIDTGVHATAICESINVDLIHTNWVPMLVGSVAVYQQIIPIDVSEDDKCTVDLYYDRDTAAELTETEITEILAMKSDMELIDCIDIVTGAVIVECYGDCPSTDLKLKVIKHVTSDNNSSVSDIDDEIIDVSKTWSSTKIQGLFDEISKGAIKGKSLEFIWDDTRLGVRQSGYNEYHYADLKGNAGLDGGSVVNAEVDEAGDLILEVPSSNNFMNYNAVTVLKETHNISATQEYHTILEVIGAGIIKFIITKFDGSINIMIDDNQYGTTSNNEEFNGVIGFDLINSKLCKNDGLNDEIAFTNNIVIKVKVNSGDPKYALTGMIFESVEE